ncbi:MAG: hypothetical protein KGM15_05860 [Pseudomonadota bacterium]|nr:hypothetical protein [Pseudomonadota bacterium]
MKPFRRLDAWAVVIALLAAAPALAAGRPKGDPDWPCQQPKVAEFPLASVWDGPPLNLDATGWRGDPATAGLAAQMSQRRVPLAEVKAAVDKMLAANTPADKDRVKQAFAAAFADLVRQRGEILAGLDRYGRRMHEMADRIRAENETARRDETPGVAAADAGLQKLQWDLRIYDDRRRTVHFVCEAPQAIEARIGGLVKLVRAAL